MRRVIVAPILVAALLGAAPPTRSGDIYEWTDENGVIHFSTSLEEVPERYRDQIKTLGPATEAEGALKESPPNEIPLAEAATTNVEGASPVSFEVPYQAREGTARRVIIPVTFNGRYTAPMALDTGAPGMVISVDLAVKLGTFSRDNGTLFVEAAGIGGSAAAILTIVDSVSVDRAQSRFVPTTVTHELSEEFHGVLGMDFLANYSIRIDSRREVVVFTENPPNPDARGGHDEQWWRETFERFRNASDHWRERAETHTGRPDSRTAAFLDFQARESERLLKRLHAYASDNAVPRHWR